MAVFGVLILFYQALRACLRQAGTKSLNPFLFLNFDRRHLRNGPLQVALERAIFHSCPQAALML
jgi:hypothetical protein